MANIVQFFSDKLKETKEYPVTLTKAIYHNDIRLDTLITDLISGVHTGGAFVTPETFGAIGDGVTDDTDAFISAIDSGIDIYGIPNKKYLVKTDLDISTNLNNLELVCEGKLTFNGKTLNIAGCKITASSGIDVMCSLSNFSNTVFTGFVQVSIPYQSGSSSSTCGNKNNFNGCEFTNPNGDGVLLEGQAFDTRFVNCIIHNCNGTGLYINGPGTSLVGCGIYSNHRGLYVHNGGGYISASKVYCNGYKAEGEAYGMKFDGALNWHVSSSDSQQNIGGNLIITGTRFSSFDMTSSCASWEQNDPNYNGSYYGVYIDGTNNNILGNIYYVGGIYSIGVDKGVYCKSNINIIPTSWNAWNEYKDFCTNPPTIDAHIVYGHSIPITSEFSVHYETVTTDIKNFIVQTYDGQAPEYGKLLLKREVKANDPLSGIIVGRIDVPDGVTIRLANIKLLYTDDTEVSSPLNSGREGYNLVKNSSVVYHTFDFTNVVDTTKEIAYYTIMIYFMKQNDSIEGEFTYTQSLALH